MSDEMLNKIMMKADSDLDSLKDRCHDLYEENQNLKARIFKARKMIFDNYGLLDKYELELLDDILKGDE